MQSLRAQLGDGVEAFGVCRKTHDRDAFFESNR